MQSWKILIYILPVDGGYDGASWQILDINTYSTDVESSNDPSVPPTYSRLYNSAQVGNKPERV